MVAQAGLFAGPSRAQVPQGTVTGTGTVELKRQPETLRLQVEVVVKAKDLKEALAKLKARREAVGKQVVTLGAAKNSVEFSEPVLANEKTDRHLQIQRMMLERLGKPDKVGGKGATKAALPVLVSMTLKADWPLKAAGPEDLLLQIHELQEKVKAADLGGVKENEKLTPEEEEIAEEMQAAIQQQLGQEAEAKRGEPSFFYVCKVSEEDRAKALAEAFQKARKDAGRLARAAGQELGTLQGLSSQNQGGEVEPSAGIPPYLVQQLRAGQGNDGADSGGEALGVQPGKVTYRIMVSAAFYLKAPPGK